MGSSYLQSPGQAGFFRFWTGMLLFCLPAFWRILSHSATRNERIFLLIAAGIFSYLPKIFACPAYFCLPGELTWWRSTQNLVTGAGTASAGLAINGAGNFPGLPLLAAVLQSMSGQSVFQAGLIVTGVLHVLGLLAVFLLAERMFLSQRAGAASALIYLSLPGFIGSSTQFSGGAMAGSLLLVALLAAQSLAESNGAVDRPGWGMLMLCLILVIVFTHPGAALLLAFLLILMALSARMLRHFSGLSAQHTLWKFALFACVASSAWLFTFAADTLVPFTQSIQNGLRQTSQSLPELLTPAGLPELGILLLVLLLAVFGLRLIFRLSLPVLAASFGILASSVLLFVTFPLLISGGSTGVYLPWMITSLGASLLCGLALAWLSGTRSYRESRKITLIRRTGPALAATALLASSMLLAPPYPDMPGHINNDPTGALKPDHVDAARWILEQAGPGNRLMSDETNLPVFSSYGLQEPAYRISGTLPAAMKEPTWNYEALYSIIRTRSTFFVLDSSEVGPSIPVTGIHWTDTRNRSTIPAEALQKFDQLPFLSRVYDAGALRIYQLSSDKATAQAPTQSAGTARYSETATSEASSFPLPGGVETAQTLLVFLLLLFIPGYLAGAVIFADWNKMDMAARAVLSICLSIVVILCAGLLSALTPAGIKRANAFIFGWMGLSALLVYRPAVSRVLSGRALHLPTWRPLASSSESGRTGPAAVALLLAGIFLSSMIMQSVRPSGTAGTVLALDLSAPLRVHLESREAAVLDYHLAVGTEDGLLWNSDLIRLSPGQAVEIDLTSHVQALGEKSALNIALLVDGRSGPYRSLHLPASQVNQLLQSIHAAR